MTRTLAILAALSFVAVPSCKRETNIAQLPPAAPSAPATAPKPASQPVAAPPAPAPTASAENAAEPQTGSPFFSGTTEAHRKSTITPKVSSSVTRVHVRDGDVVKSGQAMVTLDTQDFALRTQQAEAALQGAKVQVDATKLEFDRIKALLAEKAVPQSQYDMLDAKYKGALASLKAAETAVAMGKKALHDAVVRAPFNGIIVKRMINEGEYASMMPATPLVAVEEIDPIDLRIQIPAADLRKVQVGDNVHVRFPALNKDMDLRLTRVVPASDPRTRTFSAIVEIPNPDHELRSGLYAEVKLGPDTPAPATATATTKGKRRAAKAKAKAEE
jgi:RND family efflux transporter MFP subunit